VPPAFAFALPSYFLKKSGRLSHGPCVMVLEWLHFAPPFLKPFAPLKLLKRFAPIFPSALSTLSAWPDTHTTMRRLHSTLP